MKILLLSLVLVVSLLASCSNTDDLNPICATKENVAIKGFDTVSYFVSEGAVKGNPQFEFVWKGAKWLFSSKENMEKFKQEPEKYAPQFGGYCSFAVSKGYTADGDPNAWKVVDGKLYLNYNPEVKKKWEAEQQKLIEDAEKNWKGFETKKPEHKG